MKIYEVNATTGIETTREATIEEKAEIEATQNDAQAKKAEFVAEIEAQKSLKDSAINKLIDLGLTEDEAKAFLG